MLSLQASISGGYDGPIVSAAFSASADYQKNEETNSQRSTQTIITKAECVVFHATLPEFMDRPKFAKGFEKAVLMAMELPEGSKAKVLYEIFDRFGTHFPNELRFGSRFGMITTISSAASSKFGSESMSASIAVSLNKEIEQKQKCDGPCSQTGRENDIKSKMRNAMGKSAKKGKDDKKKSPGLERKNAMRGLERLMPALDQYDAPYASLLEVQAGRVHHRKHATDRGRHGGKAKAVADLEEEAAPRPMRETARASHAPLPVRGVPAGDVRGFLINTLREKREAEEREAATAGLERREREFGPSGEIQASGSKSSSDAEAFASESSSMQMVSMGAPPMGDIVEWAQQSGDFPMPISTKLSDICLLVASVVSGKQVASFVDTANGVYANPSGTSNMSTAQKKVLAEKGKDWGLKTVLGFDPVADDPSGTVTACLKAARPDNYCVNHLRLGGCAGPQTRPTPSAYPSRRLEPKTDRPVHSRLLAHCRHSFSACAKDEDCSVYGTKVSYKMSCNDKNKCVPQYTNVGTIKFLASGPDGSPPQTCEALSQGGPIKYTEIGDLNFKNLGHGAGTGSKTQTVDTTKTNLVLKVIASTDALVHPAATQYVDMKLCGTVSDSPPESPICDVLQVGGDAPSVIAAMDGKGVANFGFTPIPTQFGGEPMMPTAYYAKYADLYKQYGMFFTQFPIGNQVALKGGSTWFIDNLDYCNHVQLFTTSIGCNVPQMPPGEEMSCVRFVKTKDPNTPHMALGRKSRPSQRSLPVIHAQVEHMAGPRWTPIPSHRALVIGRDQQVGSTGSPEGCVGDGR